MGLPHQEFIERMKLYESSSLNVTAFCKLHNISKSRFYHYRRQKSPSASKPIDINSRVFEPVTLSKPVSQVQALKAVIYFPNQVYCELFLSGHDERLKLFKELAGL